MLMRVACARCRLASLWTDEPQSFLATICRDRRRCEATLLDEEFQRIPVPPLAEAATRPSTHLDGGPAL
jgi:hypothetical protein